MVYENILSFLDSSLGRILIRVGCVSFIGGGIYFYIMKIADRIELFKSSKKRKMITLTAEILAYTMTILFSFLVSFVYELEKMDILNIILESLLYGFGAICILNMCLTGGFYKILKIILRKKK